RIVRTSADIHGETYVTRWGDEICTREGRARRDHRAAGGARERIRFADVQEPSGDAAEDTGGREPARRARCSTGGAGAGWCGFSAADVGGARVDGQPQRSDDG